MRGKRMSGKLKSITAFLLTLAMVFSIFTYLPAGNLKVLATSAEGLRFTGATEVSVTEGTSGTVTYPYGTVSVSGTNLSTNGTNEIRTQAKAPMTLTFTPVSGYKTGAVRIDGSLITLSGNSYTWTPSEEGRILNIDVAFVEDVAFTYLDFNTGTATVNTTDNKVTYKVGETDIVVNITDTSTGAYTWDGVVMKIKVDKLADIKFSIADYSNVRDGISVKVDKAGAMTDITPNGDGEFYLNGVLAEVADAGQSYRLRIDSNNSGGGDPQPSGNTNAVINLSGPDGSWHVNPMVRENYDTVSEEGCSAPYKDYAYTVSVSINGGEMTKGASQYNKDDKSGYATRFGSQNITYNREDGEEKVDIKFFTSWANRIESVTINGVVYDDGKDDDDAHNIPLNYDDRNSWLNAFGGQGIGFTIKNVPVPTPLDANNREVYNIEVKVRPITEEECFIGNFLWSNDDRMDPEVSGKYNDMYIGHSNLELISITYNDGTGEKTVNYEDLLDEYGNETVPFIHQNTAINVETGIEMSEMVVPEGSWVTMKIETKYGYQVKSFNLNGNDVRLGDTSVFSFRIGKGNFHIGAHVEKQEDEAKVKADAVSEAAVELADGTLDTGSARLEVADADVSTAKKAEFESEADEAGYEIESYLDLSLNQVFYKGTGNSDDVWANPMNDLDNPATISLALSDDIDPEDVVIIHNIHNGNEFEVIDTEYIEEYNAISFETDSFSDFAIATKTEEPTTPTKPDTPTKPETTYVSMYRLYNPNSGEHFYTSNVAEKNNLVNLGWNDEGVAWDAPKTSDTPVYRLYNPNAGDHHYTVSAGERDFLVNVGWNYEGIGWYSTAKDGAPLYRLYNPNAVTGTHHYTISAGERDHLKSLGWNDEGIAWYGVK